MSTNRPKIFFSYARQDLDTARQLQQILEARGYILWRDQESVYGGQNWPKAIGEAIAGHDCVLLLWSKQASRAHFVEFEWTTALALRKTIVPCLLDTTPLPPSLSAVNGIPIKNFEEDLPELLTSLPTTVSASDPGHRSYVIENLSAAKPEAALATVKNMIKQEATGVHGDVYQAGGDIHVTVEKREESPFKRVLEKWHYGVAILVGILTVVQITRKEFFGDDALLDSDNPVVEEQIVAGFIQDGDGNAMVGVVAILTYDDFTRSDTTDATGRYKFMVPDAPKQATVVLRLMRGGRNLDWKETPLGNSACDFILRDTR